LTVLPTKRHVNPCIYAPVTNETKFGAPEIIAKSVFSEVKDAWIATYNIIADAMKRAAAEVPADAAIIRSRR
jgi:hemoglobin-like flavoprotein